jgi:hypothetical protein
MSENIKKNLKKLSVSVVAGVVLFILLSLIFTALFALPAVEPRLEQEVIKPEGLYIGTPFQLKVLITTGIDQEVYHPVKDTIDVFAVIGTEKRIIPATDKNITQITYRLAPFETGEVRLPPLEFELFDTQNNEITIIRSLPVDLQIISVLSETEPDLNLKDIASPLRIGFGFWDYFLPALLLVLLIIAGYLFWKRLRKRDDPLTAEAETDKRPPYQKALQLLELLKNRRLLEKGGYLEYYFQLSHIFRFFLEDHYKFNAVEMTGSEIKDCIRDFPHKERLEINKFLTETELVKYARFVPPVSQALKQTEWLEQYFRSFARRELNENEGLRNENSQENQNLTTELTNETEGRVSGEEKTEKENH